MRWRTEAAWALLVGLGPILAALGFVLFDPTFDLVEDDGVSLTQPLLSDAFAQLKSGRVPWWSDATGCGYPLLGRCYWGLYPLHLVSHGLGLLIGVPHQEIAISHLLSLGLGACAAFVYLRYCRVGRWFAALAAFAFGFNGILLGLAINWNDYAYWIAYAPLAFLAVEKVGAEGNDSWFWPLLLGLLGSLVYLSGGMVGLAKFGILVGGYYLLRVDWSRFRQSSVRLVAAGLLVLLVCAGPMLANYEYVRMTTRLPEGGLSPTAALAIMAMAPEFYRGFIYPIVETRWYGGFNFTMFADGVGRFNGAGAFVGPLAPLAVCFAIGHFRKPGVHRALLVLTAVYFFLSLGSHWEGNLLLVELPFFKHYRWPARWIVEFAAAAALLVGPALEIGWQHRTEPASKLGVAFFLLLVIAALTLRPEMTTEWEFDWKPVGVAWLGFSIAVAYFFQKGDRRTFEVVALVFTVAGLLCAIPGAQRHRWGLLNRLKNEPLTIGVGENDRVLYLAARDDQRGPTVEGGYAYCLPHVLGSRTVFTYGPFQLQNQQWQAGINMFGEMYDADAASRCFLKGHMLDVLRVGYVVVPRDQAVLNQACRDQKDLRLLTQTKTKNVYRYEGPRPPAFFVREVRPESELPNLAELGQHRLSEVAFVDFGVDSLPPRTFTGVGRIQDYQESNGVITLQAQATGDQFLVLTTTWYPHWKATIDGQPASIYRVDGSFMALRIPDGTHSVRLEFWPTWFAYLYAFNGVVFIGLFVVCLVGGLNRVWLSPSPPPGGVGADPPPGGGLGEGELPA